MGQRIHCEGIEKQRKVKWFFFSFSIFSNLSEFSFVQFCTEKEINLFHEKLKT